MKILITGASGALGGALLEYYIRLGAGKIFTTSRRNICRNDHIIADLAINNDMLKVLDLAGPDYIFHTAVSFSDNLDEAYQLNVKSSLTILDYIKKNALKTKVVLFGSSAEYGVIQSSDNPISETYQLNPISPYGITKAWQSQIIKYYANHGVDVKCARIFNLVGKNVSKNTFVGAVNSQVDKVLNKKQKVISLGSLENIRDFILIEDAATQIVKIANFGVPGDVYHVGSGVPISIKDFVINTLKNNNLSSSLLKENPENYIAKYKSPLVLYADMTKTKNI